MRLDDKLRQESNHNGVRVLLEAWERYEEKRGEDGRVQTGLADIRLVALDVKRIRITYENEDGIDILFVVSYFLLVDIHDTLCDGRPC